MKSWSREWVMHQEPCPPPPARTEFSCEELGDLWAECVRYEQECYRIRQKHYDIIDEILEPKEKR